MSEMKTALSSEGAPTVRPRPRVRLLHAIESVSAAAGIEVTNMVRDRLFDLPPDEFEALLQRVADDLGGILRGIGEKPAVPSLDVQIENFESWQNAHGAGYFAWSAEAMRALRGKLIEFGEGIELIPCYAMSVQVKLQNGRLILIDRNGRETKS